MNYFKKHERALQQLFSSQFDGIREDRLGWTSYETFSSESFTSEIFDCFLKQSNVSEEIF
jgi:hypothetical protein